MKLRQSIFLRTAILLTITIISISSLYLYFIVIHHRSTTLNDYTVHIKVLSERFNKLMLWDDRVRIKSELLAEVKVFDEVIYAFIIKNNSPYEYSFKEGFPKTLLNLPDKQIYLFKNNKGEIIYNISMPVYDNISLNIGLKKRCVLPI